jgi:hypothetical protein
VAFDSIDVENFIKHELRIKLDKGSLDKFPSVSVYLVRLML